MKPDKWGYGLSSEQENMAAGDVQMLHWQDSLIANLASGYANTTGRTIAMRHPSGLLSDGFNVAPLSKPSGPFTQGYVSQGPGEVMMIFAASDCCCMFVCIEAALLQILLLFRIRPIQKTTRPAVMYAHASSRISACRAAGKLQ